MAKKKSEAKGPRRSKESPVKQLCGYKACRKTKCDVKNSMFVLAKDKVDSRLCRRLRQHCKIVKFCGLLHMKKAELQPPKKRKRGREALDVEQTALLFDTLKSL